MPEKTKQQKVVHDSEAEKLCAEETEKETEIEDKDDLSKDQQEKSYYYDDSYGYEIYDAESDDEDE